MIITPLQLWKDYDRTKTPLNSSVASKTQKDGYNIRYVYFNGEESVSGTTRIYAKLIEPAVISKNAVLVMDDINNGVDGFLADEFLSIGCSVLVVDYAGETELRSRYTMYPKPLSFANYFSEKSSLSEPPLSVSESCRYVWSTVALRSVTFLESEGYEKISMLGVGEGGHQVFVASYLPSVLTAGAIRFSGTLVKEPVSVNNTAEPSSMALESDNLYISYKASLSQSAYAPFLKVPVFFQLTSNEQNSSLDEMNSLFTSCTEKNALLSISELSDRSINNKQSMNVAKFFECCFLNKPLPKTPKLTAKASQRSLYLNILTYSNEDGEYEIESVKLYVAHCQKISAYRNWNNHTIENIGKDEYLAKVSVFATSEPLYAFVNVQYKNGFNISSPVLALTPSIWDIEPVNFVTKRRIYDGDMGTGEWLVMNDQSSNNGSVELMEGPFNISGVTAKNSNRLLTFILADTQYLGADDATLQLIIYSPINQTLTFSITSSNNFIKYSCEKQIFSADNWAKFTLSPSDFKSTEKNFDSWKKVIIFEISGTDTFIINSMLWV